MKNKKNIFAVAILAAFLLFPTIAYADGPLESVNKLTDIVFQIVRAVGFIALMLGVVQIGMSFKSHDPSQRVSGFLGLAGGILIFFVKELLNLLGANL